MRRWWGIGVVCAGVVIGCSDPAPQRICSPGATQACFCANGGSGAQSCSATGTTWLACQCGTSSCTNNTSRACQCSATQSGTQTCSNGVWSGCSCGGSSCYTIAGMVSTVSQPAITCGVPGSLTVNIIQQINAFWQSQMSACACDDPIQSQQIMCTNNAEVLSQTPGWIYYDRNILNWLTQQANGDPIGAAWFLSHEAGHNLQIFNNLPASSPKARELEADCLSGYFLAWLQCTKQATQMDINAVLGAICAAGDPIATPWFASSHGTCPERVQQVTRGYQSYQQSVRPSVACVF